ncbi:DNA photolyase [bacterium]|nr:DNA photolyase [bacterium]
MKTPRVSKIIVRNDVAENTQVKLILNKFNESTIIPGDDFILPEHVEENGTGLSLHLQQYKGDFLTKCPGTQNYICCGYKVLSTVLNCNLGCSYCVLQGYYKTPVVTVNVNVDDLIAELSRKLSTSSTVFYRIGTGEFSDSLAYEEVLGFAELLVPYFSKRSNVIFELKTKTDNIQRLLETEHGSNIMVSWSVAPERIVKSEERITAALESRLKAARRCQEAGYLLGLHFDPMIYYPEWEIEYKNLVDRIFSYIDPRKVVWISLGAFRFPAKWKEIMLQNYPDSKIFYGEFFPGLDDKLRYLKPIRVNMFRKMYEWLKSIDKNLFIYLCMESDSVWKKSFGWSPGNTAGLSKMLDERSKIMIKT